MLFPKGAQKERQKSEQLKTCQPFYFGCVTGSKFLGSELNPWASAEKKIGRIQ